MTLRIDDATTIQGATTSMTVLSILGRLARIAYGQDPNVCPRASS